MTIREIKITSVVCILLGTLHFLVVWDSHKRTEPDEDPIINQVKHEYTISCTAGQTLKYEFYTCKDLKRFIDKYEGRDNAKTIRSKLVSEARR
jgi:hypothetical protein